jgi:hypothetical protein
LDSGSDSGCAGTGSSTVGVATSVSVGVVELVNVTGYRTFRQVAWAGSYEGESTVGLGTRARLPFRVFILPGHLVVDVAHAW